MSRYQKMFDRLIHADEGAFVPFVTIYDPDRTTSLAIISTLIKAGADAIELGLPFSDPLADGPVIQKANLRALRNGCRVREAFDLIREVRAKWDDIPIGILTYANIVFRNSLEWFYRHCHESGVDSVLVADVPLLEAQPFCDAAMKNNVAPILIAPPNLPLERCADIAKLGRAYTYVVSRKGVTGQRDEIDFSHHNLITELKRVGAPPVLLGFGVSTPAHVKSAIDEGACGAISGSRVVSIIEDHLDNQELLLQELEHFVRVMKEATR